MTFEEACAVRMPSGKTIGQATPADWEAAERFWREEGARYQAMTVAQFAQSEDRALAAAFYEREIEWNEAMVAVWTRIGEGADGDETRRLASQHVANAEAALKDLPRLVELARSNGRGSQQNG